MVECFSNYLKIVQTDWRSRLNYRNIESVLRIKVEGLDLKELVEKIIANAVTLWWESKERCTTQRKHKNYKKKIHLNIDELLCNISSTDNSSDDSDGERSDSNIDILVD